MQDLMFEVKNKTFSRGGHLLANLVPMLEQKSIEKGYFSRKVNKKVQEEPQAEAAANPRHQEEEKK